MPFTDTAHYDGQDYPRCQAKPTKADQAELYQHGRFECALPAGHADPKGEFKADPRIRSHSWSQVGEV